MVPTSNGAVLDELINVELLEEHLANSMCSTKANWHR